MNLQNVSAFRNNTVRGIPPAKKPIPRPVVNNTNSTIKTNSTANTTKPNTTSQSNITNSTNQSVNTPNKTQVDPNGEVLEYDEYGNVIVKERIYT